MAQVWSDLEPAKTLIGLFVKNSLEQLTANEGRVLARAFGADPEDYAQLCKKDEFNKPYRILLAMRLRVEQIIRLIPDDTADQLKKSLALLKLERRRNGIVHVKICRRMLEAALVPAWTEAQKREFAEAADIFEFVDYFLSYTNKTAADINYRFRMAFLPPTRVKAEDPATVVNYVARDVVDRLRLNNLSGFFDAQKIDLGDKVRRELTIGASTAVVFVQLVEQAMLVEPDDGSENWCYSEFELYRAPDAPQKKAEGRLRKFAFLITVMPKDRGPPAFAVKPAQLPECYERWFGEMVEDRVEVLRPEDPITLGDQVNTIAKKIVGFRDELFNSIVDENFVFAA
jgi:hypothetical protein